MQIPLQITYRGLSPSDAVKARLEHEAEKLQQFSHRITSCHAVVEKPHKSHHHGDRFQIRLELEVPGHDLVITTDSDEESGHEDVFVAIRDAFQSAQRLLKKYQSRQRDLRRRPNEPEL